MIDIVEVPEDMLVNPKERTLIIDAENSILGRMASYVAKLLLAGYRVIIVNAEKAVISGERKRVIDGYKLLLRVKTHKNPYRHSMKRPRTPERIVKEAVRGMLPKESWKGKQALTRLRVYVSVPDELKDKPKIKILNASHTKLRGEFITVGEVARELGWKGVGLS